MTILLGSVPVKATHMSGGEIYWDCIGPGVYEITLVVYRDCIGIELDPNYDLQIQSPCDTLTLNVSTPGGTEISQLCDLELPNSTCNGGTLPGIEQYLYTGTITLPPCDSWTISWTEIYRNNAIANLVNPGNKEMYIEAVMNNVVAPCDDSPQFTNVAIPYICAGYPISYSYGVFDPEGDSLVYSLIGARVGGAGPIPYVMPHSGLVPIPGITLDPQTGLVNFTLAQPGNWVVVVQVDIYDAQGQLIGSVMRDMQFVAYPCTNIPPDPLTGTVANMSGTAVQTGDYAIEVCESGDFCFDMVISDPNANNVLEATTNIQQNLPGATFSYTGTNPITCSVCWTAAAGTAGFFPFIVTVSDGACPIPAFQTYVYAIQVQEGLFIDVTSTDESCGGAGDGTATATVTAGDPPFNYLWSTGDTTATIQASPGTYTVTVSDANQCGPASATVTIATGPAPPNADAGQDAVGCPGDPPIPLNGVATNAANTTWSGGQGTFNGQGANTTYTPHPNEVVNGGAMLLFTAEGNGGCPDDQDTVMIYLSKGFPNPSLLTEDPSCHGGANGAIAFSPTDSTYAYSWDDPNAQTTPTAIGLSSGIYQVTVTDALGCDSTFSAALIDPPALQWNSLSEAPVSCHGDADGSATAQVQGGTPGYTFIWTSPITNQSGNTATGLAAGPIDLLVTDSAGCILDTTLFIPEPTPVTASVTAPDTVCVNAPFWVSASASGGNGGYLFDWGVLGTGDSLNLFLSATQSLVLNVQDSLGCSAPSWSDTIHVLDLASGTLMTSNDTMVCAGDAANVAAWVTGYNGAVEILWPGSNWIGGGPFVVAPVADSTFAVMVTDACGSMLNGAITVAVEAPLALNVPPVWAEGCAELEVEFPSNIAPGAVGFLWDFGDGETSTQADPTHMFSEGIWDVSLQVISALGCVTSAPGSGQVIAHGTPEADFLADPWQTDLDAPEIEFSDQSSPGILLHQWDFGDGGTSTDPDPTHTYSDVGTFPVTLWVEDGNGCAASITIPVVIDAVHDIVIPNAFTPTGNGGGLYDPTDLSNDVFYPFARSVSEFNMRIYDRWGELIFESNDIRQGWDGTYRGELSPQDVYVYQVNVRFVDGKQSQRIGDVTLFR
ncbi:MAG: gliding motility-associated C-terminal domain-containing protein [Flavobacteriales bacterium]|nr:gliding motility-associated C-terminal domain-containing protein [Flavobacteriales bacterium]